MNKYSIYMKYKDSHIIINNVFDYLKDKSDKSIEVYIKTNCYTTNYKDVSNMTLAIANDDKDYIAYVALMSKRIKLVLKTAYKTQSTDESHNIDIRIIKLIHKYIFDNYLQLMDNKWYFNIDSKLRKVLTFTENIGSYKTLQDNINIDADFGDLTGDIL